VATVNLATESLSGVLEIRKLIVFAVNRILFYIYSQVMTYKDIACIGSAVSSVRYCQTPEVDKHRLSANPRTGSWRASLGNA